MDGDTESRALQINNIEDGILEKEILLEDVRAAYKSEVLNDILIICSDGIKVSSNRNFLAIRVPFFEKMFFGSFQNAVQDEVEFNSCDSRTFNYILNYIWYGALELKHLNFLTLQSIMETSRLLCIDSLWKGVERHISHRIFGGKVSICECFDALEFAAVNKFDKLLECLFIHLDLVCNRDSADTVSRFESVSMVAAMSLVSGDFDEVLEDKKFEFFLNWIKKNEVDSATKRNMLDAFDLEKFSSLYLLKTVQKTGYFKDEDIFSILIENVTAYENSSDEKDKRIHYLESRLDYESDYSDY